MIYDCPVSLLENLNLIQQRIRSACDRCGREPNSVTLLAVSKAYPPETIQAAADCGLAFFGENKIQEAKAKIPLCPGKLRWHFIGHLQSNKVRDAVALFEMIQGVDSLGLAQEISKRAEQAAKRMPILLEANLSGEASKFGYKPEKLLSELKEINFLPRLEIRGLMTVPPFFAEQEKVRPYFQRLRELKAQCEQVISAPLPHLSMGMSGDFEVAIEEGATIIRIGTALFGPRAKAKLRAEAD
ncbi:MAG TPA: YggS family pyridoxal phosphate-dependent enzyme [Dongiaceae bacterium]|jgi:pyridoxal phosphate enzyme (YggS family)|nr:YggS family pyridoxal phosphate-dependent enzyme [Dongiaceae bacterium]